ncbi:MAG: hypothetical protein Q9202_007332 [Teloschistes flavicans]
MEPQNGEAIHSERFLRIACIGAGASASRCACDIPAHNYTFSFEPNEKWSTVYPSSTEIKRYLVEFSERHDLRRYIRFENEVLSAQWSDSASQWKLQVRTGQGTSCGTIETYDIVIHATGYLNNWAWPDIGGRQDYSGHLLHSAQWDSSVSLDGKVVGLIGNGSSAVQILPSIQPVAEHVFNFIRSPNWIVPSLGEDNHSYSEEDIEGFQTDSDSLLVLRKRNEASLNSYFSVFLKDSKLQQESAKTFTEYMRERIADRKLDEHLIPTWGIGCRRIVPSNKYLEALQQENVTIVPQNVNTLTQMGCRCTNGTDYPVEVLVCATGFDTSFRPRFPITTGQARTEVQADHILQLIDRYQTENIRSFRPKPAAVSDFMAHVRDFMGGTVWTQGCRSGYKNHTIHDKTPTLWPGSSLHYREALRELRAEDWDFEYLGNRFDWLGNGFSQAEFDPTCDLGYYIRSQDDGPYASRRKRGEALTRSGTQPSRPLHRIYRPTVVNL